MIKKFTFNGYKSLLETALKNEYQFINFSEANTSTFNRKCILRHDVDVSIDAACEMAKIEHSLSVKSTYFLMLRSPVYNLFSRSNHNLVNKIINLGHSIGIHYDEAFYAKEKNLNDLIREEIEIIQNMFEIEIKTLSFHQPSKKIINNEIKINNLINTYDKGDMNGFNYISDSNKTWKESTLWDIFKQRKYSNLHLLIHPLWWMTKEDLPTEELWSKNIISNFKREEKQIISTERAYGTERNMALTFTN
ncbi:MAG: hypothetical protein JST67_03185 [Bacteroidetes bacterium]|nr:hypothetical protein [Bacteroidota bacterium]